MTTAAVAVAHPTSVKTIPKSEIRGRCEVLLPGNPLGKVPCHETDFVLVRDDGTIVAKTRADDDSGLFRFIGVEPEGLYNLQVTSAGLRLLKPIKALATGSSYEVTLSFHGQ